MIISKNLKLSDIPETMWLPPEVRSMLMNGPLLEQTTSVCDQLVQSFSALSDRIFHVESHLLKLNMDARLQRLESVFHPFEVPSEHGLPVIPPSYVPHQRRIGA